MKTTKIISEYIARCAKQGISSPAEIREHVIQHIAEIDQKLLNFDSLRIERAKHQKILEHFDEYLNTEAQTSTLADSETETFKVKITEILKESGPLTNREIISKFGYNADVKVIRALKWMHEQNLIQRLDDADRKITLV